ncbi:MAG: thioredoxin domain-containing protein, partial [Flavobacteriaceae bacterium]|nr:thioredoxin domain-containing protein [Flavobacteriaceae bacterium]
MENKLSKEKSLYLKQHASNPVNWFPWGKEAFSKAKDLEKLLVISIGYSSCHWCHVMEEESFEKEDVAEVMNNNYISIKVDREERPDIDEIYMKALVLMTGSGGWPMNIIALPDGTPIWGGTYVPKLQWMQVLDQINEFYKNRKTDVLKYAKSIKEGVRKEALVKPVTDKEIYSDELQKQLANNAFKYTDKVNGGFGNSQKFPLPSMLNFFLRFSIENENEEMKNFVYNSLIKIAQGGINDRVEGGFHRYTVDNLWHIPHFEKMLYDNAQLLSVFSKAYKVFKEPRFEEELNNIYNFLELKMTGEDNLIYSSISADTNYEDGSKEEGDFYIWKKEELQELLEEDYKWVSEYYNINDKGFWERESYVFIQTTSDQKFASKLNLDLNQFKAKLKLINKKLYNFREKRINPITDTKIIFSWNALTIRGLVDSYKATGDKIFLNKALAINKALSQFMISGSSIFHTNSFNKVNQVLFFEDYSYYIDALIGLYEVTFDEKWLTKANDFTQFSNVKFKENNGYYKFSTTKENLYTNTLINLEDGVTPSANSVMNFNLFRLGHYLGKKEYSQHSKAMIKG